MASFSCSETESSVTISVRGISNGSSVRFYVRLDPDPGYATVDRTYTSSGTTMSKTFSGLDAETDYAANVCVNGTWVGTQYFTTLSEPSIQRPYDWEWWRVFQSGNPVLISATQWNLFCDRINQFREYVGLSSYNFYTASSGDEISAWIVNEAVDAISDMTTRWLPGYVRRGDPITPSFFDGLRDALNSID